MMQKCWLVILILTLAWATDGAAKSRKRRGRKKTAVSKSAIRQRLPEKPAKPVVDSGSKEAAAAVDAAVDEGGDEEVAVVFDGDEEIEVEEGEEEVDFGEEEEVDVAALDDSPVIPEYEFQAWLLLLPALVLLILGWNVGWRAAATPRVGPAVMRRRPKGKRRTTNTLAKVQLTAAAATGGEELAVEAMEAPATEKAAPIPTSELATAATAVPESETSENDEGDAVVQQSTGTGVS